MNPRAIGIDILIDQAQPEDDELIAAFRAMRTPTYLAFATNAANPDQIEYWQEQFLRDFLRRVGAGPVRPTSIRMEPDPADGVIRRWPRQNEGLPPLLSNALTRDHPEFRGYTRSIDFRLPGTGESRRGPDLHQPADPAASRELGDGAAPGDRGPLRADRRRYPRLSTITRRR